MSLLLYIYVKIYSRVAFSRNAVIRWGIGRGLVPSAEHRLKDSRRSCIYVPVQYLSIPEYLITPNSWLGGSLPVWYDTLSQLTYSASILNPCPPNNLVLFDRQ